MNSSSILSKRLRLLKIEEIDNIISKQLQFNPEKIVREIYDLDEQT